MSAHLEAEMANLTERDAASLAHCLEVGLRHGGYTEAEQSWLERIRDLAAIEAGHSTPTPFEDEVEFPAGEFAPQANVGPTR